MNDQQDNQQNQAQSPMADSQTTGATDTPTTEDTSGSISMGSGAAPLSSQLDQNDAGATQTQTNTPPIIPPAPIRPMQTSDQPVGGEPITPSATPAEDATPSGGSAMSDVPPAPVSSGGQPMDQGTPFPPVNEATSPTDSPAPETSEEPRA